MQKLLAGILALGAAVLGAANLAGAVDSHLFEALQTADAWIPLSAALAGWLVVQLAPANAVGWLLLGSAWSSALFGWAAVVVLGEVGVPAGIRDVAAWLGTWAFLPSYLIAFLLIPLLFPDGRLPSQVWRPVLVAAIAFTVLESALLAFGSRTSIDEEITNPWQVSAVSEVLETVEPAIWFSMPVLAVLGVASLAHRIVVRRGPHRLAAIALATTGAIGLTVLLMTGEGVVLGLLLPVVVAAVHANHVHGQLVHQVAFATEQAETLRASRARITKAHDNARRRIERDLHDGAQQALLALSVGLRRLAAKADPQMRGDAEHLLRLSMQTLTDLRKLASGTYPSALRELGVGPALREAVGNRVQVMDDFGDRPQQETEAALYFACLEAITNAQKHADARTIAVHLDRTPEGGFRFRVTDDGIGLVSAVGNGIDGMADRLGARGGTLDIQSTPGQGTVITGVVYDAPR
jgi:signal transduction histidine kinase